MRSQILAVRIVLALLGSWLLLRLFFEGGGPTAIIAFAALILGATYIVEWMKRDRAEEERQKPHQP